MFNIICKWNEITNTGHTLLTYSYILYSVIIRWCLYWWFQWSWCHTGGCDTEKSSFCINRLNKVKGTICFHIFFSTLQNVQNITSVLNS